MIKNSLILRYKTPFGYYIYDGNHNQIIKVYKELFDYITCFFNQGNIESHLFSKKVKNDLIQLKELGYFNSTNIKKVEHPLTNGLEYILDRKINQITLQITQNCNLRCSYCIYSEMGNHGQRNYSNKKMSFETAKKAIEFYRKHSQDSERAIIAFYGGEPLLEFDLLKKIVGYAKKVFEGKPLGFTVTTNATLLTEEIIEFLVKNKFFLTLSIDGPQKIHDKNRKFANGKGSFKLVKNNIRSIYEKYPSYLNSVMISMVIDPEVEYKDVVELFESPEFQKVKLSYTPVEVDGIASTFSEKFSIQYNYDSFLGYLNYFRNNEKKEYPSKIIEEDFNKIDTHIVEIHKNTLSSCSAPAGQCLPGKMRLFINCEGDLYPCERVNENNCMKIGNITEGFDYENVRKLLNIGKITADECSNCFAFQLCNICIKRADDDGIISADKKMQFCNTIRNSALTRIRKHILKYENELYEKSLKNDNADKKISF